MLWLLLILVAGGPADGGPAPINLKPVSSLDMSEHEIFSDFSFAVTDKDTIVVGDPNNHQLLYLDQEGNLIKKVGGQGEGPGEFQNTASIEWYSKEKCLRVVDFGNRRISSWSETGELLGEIKFPRPMIFQFKFTNKDHMLTAQDLAGHFEGKPKLVDINLEDNQAKELWAQELPGKMPLTEIPGVVARLNNWDPKLNFDAGSNFIAVNWGQSPHMQILDMDGKVIVRNVKLGLPQPPVSDEDVERQLAEWEPRFRAGLRKGLARAEVWPTVFDIRVDDQDRIWVFGFRTQDSDPYPFRLFDAKGKLLGEGQVPNIPKVTRDAFYYLLEGDDGTTLNRANYQL